MKSEKKKNEEIKKGTVIPYLWATLKSHFESIC